MEHISYWGKHKLDITYPIADDVKNQTTVVNAIEAGNTTTSSITTAYDPLGRIESEIREIDGHTYTTSYRYDRIGKITGTKYPGSDSYLEYGYNNLNQIVSLDGIADGTINDPAFTYSDNGLGVRYIIVTGSIKVR